MKKTLLKFICIFLAVSFTSCTTSKRFFETPPTVISNIENTDDKATNYVKANEWMVDVFNNAESVIQFKDKEAGVIKGKYVLLEGVANTRPTFYAVITLRVKDNAARIEIDPPSGMYSEMVLGTEIGFTEPMFNNEANRLIEKFEIHMKERSANNDW